MWKTIIKYIIGISVIIGLLVLDYSTPLAIPPTITLVVCLFIYQERKIRSLTKETQINVNYIEALMKNIKTINDNLKSLDKDYRVIFKKLEKCESIIDKVKVEKKLEINRVYGKIGNANQVSRTKT
jgi:hypothetical protein